MLYVLIILFILSSIPPNILPYPFNFINYVLKLSLIGWILGGVYYYHSHGII